MNTATQTDWVLIATQTNWLAISVKDKFWAETPQEQINDKNWYEAVAIAKKKAIDNKTLVRLSTSIGYRNQGHYFHVNECKVKKAWLRLAGNRWLVEIEGEEDFATPHRPLTSGEIVVEYCNMYCLSVQNKDCLIPELQQKLMY